MLHTRLQIQYQYFERTNRLDAGGETRLMPATVYVDSPHHFLLPKGAVRTSKRDKTLNPFGAVFEMAQRVKEV